MNDAGNESKSGETAMLSMDQVTSIIEKMNERHEAMLRTQRDEIIQHVMDSLRASGLALPSNRAQLKARVQSKDKSPTRLERNLHTLVLHSLSESGLDLPHVQKLTYTPIRCVETKSSQLCEPSEVVERAYQSNPIIISREERCNELEISASTSLQQLQESPSQELEELVGRDSQTIRQAKRNQTRKFHEDKLLYSPLISSANAKPKRSTSKSSYQRQATAKPRSDNMIAHSSDEYADCSNSIEAEFNAVREKVSQKTHAILKKSKTLLSEAKQPIKKSNCLDGDTENRFIENMRQQYQSNATSHNASGESPDYAKRASRQTDPSQICALEQAPDTAAHIEDLNNEASDASQLREENIEPTAAIEPSSIRCDSELLRPPEHAPENEGEWENELARQILTIYATSMKAKAAGVSVTKNACIENGRPASRSIRIGAPQPRPSTIEAPTSNSSRPRHLGQSCSLPAINGHLDSSTSSIPTTRNHRRSRTIHRSWEPSQRLEDGNVIINMPKVPRPIWFAGTGAVKAVWCALAHGFSQHQPSPDKPSSTSSGKRHEVPTSLAMCEHRLCEEVRQMEAKQKFTQCITMLESLLITLIRARGMDELDIKLWKQLVVTCNAFASRCIDYQKFASALQLIKQAEHLLDNSILVSTTMRLELLAYLYDTCAHYYYRRRKPNAGIQYILKAQEIHSKQNSWSHLAKCRLHLANLLSYQRKHQEAIKHMASILEMIEENKLEETGENGDGASAQKICLAAVCYNNLAVEQLHMREFEAAHVSSANAKRLAKLCLSYSNRWLSQFEATSNCVALAIATLMEDTDGNRHSLQSRQ